MDIDPGNPVSIRYTASAIRDLIGDAMKACGLPDDDASRIAELMTEADLTGADAHGVFRLPQYVRRLVNGAVNPTPNIAVVRKSPGVAIVDGDNGMGHLVMSKAVETAIDLARETGVGWVGVRRSNHAGPGALYAEMPTRHGMIGLYSAVASANHMAIWGGVEPMLGTNPLAVGIPCGEEPPVVLDMATTVVSYGTVKKFVLQDKPIPDGWLISREDGRPITDPRKTADSLLLPIGGYKGSGLALVLGILAGTLNGAAFGNEVVDFNADVTSETNTGHFILVLDVARFMPVEMFAALLKPQLDSFRAGQVMPNVDEIRIPGDQRASRRGARASGGISLPKPLVAQLDTLADELGITRLQQAPKGSKA
jgi:LDH2 family malate/lactate/ureidoglycolate dehydrogenase